MLQYISKVFGSNVTCEKYTFPKSTPFYLTEGYTAERLVLKGSGCILITPKNSPARLPVLKKNYERIFEICGLPCALNLARLTASQRENLISCNIPFVSEHQIYLPFWGAVFSTRLKPVAAMPKIMSPSCQLVFLKIYYKLEAGEEVNASIVSSELSLPKSSVSEAINELTALNLITVTQKGTNKWISLVGENTEVLQRAIKSMRKPAWKEIYLKSIPSDIPYKLGGIKALAEKTSIASSDRDGAYVYNKESARKIPQELVISRQEFDDFGGIAAEVWRYNPALLTDNAIVDDISLLLSLRDYDDERVQKELDSIRLASLS